MEGLDSRETLLQDIYSDMYEISVYADTQNANDAREKITKGWLDNLHSEVLEKVAEDLEKDRKIACEDTVGYIKVLDSESDFDVVKKEDFDMAISYMKDLRLFIKDYVDNDNPEFVLGEEFVDFLNEGSLKDYKSVMDYVHERFGEVLKNIINSYN